MPAKKISKTRSKPVEWVKGWPKHPAIYEINTWVWFQELDQA